MDKAEKVIKELEEKASKHFMPCIGPEKGKVFEKILKKHQPKMVLEIGALAGYSSILIAMNLRENAKIITIEINKNNVLETKKNLEKAGFAKKVKVIPGDAIQILPKIKEKIDLLFLDATKEQYLKYLKLAEKNLEQGSVVVADNVGIFKDSMQDYLDYVRNSKEYKSETITVPLEFHEDIEDAMEVSIKL